MPYSVRFEEVTKRYLRGGPRYASLREDLRQGVRRAAGRLRGQPPEPRGPAALKDVSFQADEGDSLAILGPNGAGKTTALKIISRISYPTSGRVRVRGRVGALLEVGSGVHPELTARENIWLYGQILGMSKADVSRRFDEIVEFAELGHVLDRPVKMYSSGMQLRLGFSIASHLEPDVLLVDEALAVGDAGFQAKCVERMSKLVAGGRSLLFVSHNLSAAEAICRRGIFMVDGRVVEEGTSRQVIRRYLEWIDDASQARRGPRYAAASRYVQLDGVTCHDSQGNERYAFATGEDIEVRMAVTAQMALTKPHFSLGISQAGSQGNLALCSMLVDGGAPERLEGSSIIACALREVPLLPRVYELWCSIRSEQGFGDLLDWQPIGSFRITDPPSLSGPAAQAHVSTDGPVHIDHDWEVRPCQ